VEIRFAAAPDASVMRLLFHLLACFWADGQIGLEGDKCDPKAVDMIADRCLSLGASFASYKSHAVLEFMEAVLEFMEKVHNGVLPGGKGRRTLGGFSGTVGQTADGA